VWRLRLAVARLPHHQHPLSKPLTPTTLSDFQPPQTPHPSASIKPPPTTRGARHLDELHPLLEANLMLRRTKNEVDMELPVKSRFKVGGGGGCWVGGAWPGWARDEGLGRGSAGIACSSAALDCQPNRTHPSEEPQINPRTPNPQNPKPSNPKPPNPQTPKPQPPKQQPTPPRQPQTPQTPRSNSPSTSAAAWRSSPPSTAACRQ